MSQGDWIYIYIYTHTCIKFTRFQFTDALEDEKSGSHLSYPISAPNMGYLGPSPPPPETGDKMRSKDENSRHGENKGPNWFSHLKCSSVEFHPQFGFAMAAHIY
jgi:hypothetical protein